MEQWDFLQEKTLKINITIGYTSRFTTSVLKASSKFKKGREDSFINFPQRNTPVMFLPDSNPPLECQPKNDPLIMLLTIVSRVNGPWPKYAPRFTLMNCDKS